MKIIYYDGTSETCDKIEFSLDGKKIIVDECVVRQIEDIMRIISINEKKGRR